LFGVFTLLETYSLTGFKWPSPLFVSERLVTARRGTHAHCGISLNLRPAIHAFCCSWQPNLAIACSLLDAGQTNVMTNRHDRSIAELKTQNTHQAKIRERWL